MVRQFLLNADGSIPANTNVALLEAEGIPLVLPTPRWIPKAGMMLEEAEPLKGNKGWTQVWIEIPIPVIENIQTE